MVGPQSGAVFVHVGLGEGIAVEALLRGIGKTAKTIVQTVIDSKKPFNVIYAENNGMARGAAAPSSPWAASQSTAVLPSAGMSETTAATYMLSSASSIR